MRATSCVTGDRHVLTTRAFVTRPMGLVTTASIYGTSQEQGSVIAQRGRALERGVGAFQAVAHAGEQKPQ